MKKDENYWKSKLTSEEYKYLRQKGTETPFTGDLLKNKENGMYKCKACGNDLFDSQTKFESGSGWPSFWDFAKEGNVDLVEDKSLGMRRTEVVCANCKSHLGHVFDDGPSDKTGKRYCVNSACLKFAKR